MSRHATVTVATPFGPVEVSPPVARAWRVRGLPPDGTLKLMVGRQAGHRMRREAGR